MALEHYTKTIEKKLRLRSYNITYAVFFFFFCIHQEDEVGNVVSSQALTRWRTNAREGIQIVGSQWNYTCM